MTTTRPTVKDFPANDMAKLWSIDAPCLLHPSHTELWDTLKGSIFSDIETTLDKVKRRLPDEDYKRVLISILLQYRYSLKAFPAFVCHIKDFLTEEWLAMVDFSKDFHRDHIYHQPQVTDIARTLMEELIYTDPDDLIPKSVLNNNVPKDDLVKAGFGKSHKKSGDKSKTYTYSLLEVAALNLACPSRDNRYLHSYCEILELPSTCYAYKNDSFILPFLFWKKVIYNATITAAMFHDIGYPFQFQSSLSKDLDMLMALEDKHAKTNPFFHPEIKKHLFMRVLAGYEDNFHFPHPMGYDTRLFQLFREAMFKTHGMPGALIFTYLNDRLRNGVPRNGSHGLLAAEMAATGILMHDMQKMYARTEAAHDKPPVSYYLDVRHPELRVSFRADPVSYIVTLADQIEDYLRVNIQPSGEKRSKTDKNDTADTNVYLETETRVTQSQIRFCPESRELNIFQFFGNTYRLAMNLQNCDFNPKIHAQFFEPRKGYLKHDGLFSKITLHATISP